MDIEKLVINTFFDRRFSDITRKFYFYFLVQTINLLNLVKKSIYDFLDVVKRICFEKFRGKIPKKKFTEENLAQ